MQALRSTVLIKAGRTRAVFIPASTALAAVVSEAGPRETLVEVPGGLGDMHAYARNLCGAGRIRT
jgi:hypothetical protein